MICNRILILIIFFSVPYFLQAQDFNLIGAGARARGMAGAYIGIAEDITATFWNPAGLTNMDKKLRVIVCRELTKKFETIYRGTIEEVIKKIEKDIIKGEFVVIVKKEK